MRESHSILALVTLCSPSAGANGIIRSLQTMSLCQAQSDRTLDLDSSMGHEQDDTARKGRGKQVFPCSHRGLSSKRRRMDARARFSDQCSRLSLDSFSRSPLKLSGHSIRSPAREHMSRRSRDLEKLPSCLKRSPAFSLLMLNKAPERAV